MSFQSIIVLFCYLNYYIVVVFVSSLRIHPIFSSFIGRDYCTIYFCRSLSQQHTFFLYTYYHFFLLIIITILVTAALIFFTIQMNEDNPVTNKYLVTDYLFLCQCVYCELYSLSFECFGCYLRVRCSSGCFPIALFLI
jgi:hypothetical protein